MHASSDPDASRAKQSWRDLLQVLPYVEIDGKITGHNLGTILQKLDVEVDSNELKIKGIWHQFKQFHVYNTDKPLFFIKELWQPEFLREILGLHVGINYLDPELCPRRFLFGKWRTETNKEKPVLVTTYVQGPPLKKNQLESFRFILGRQHALHQVLSLYDVDWRHFIVQQGVLVRIDFGKSFSNLNIPYQGFWDLRWNRLKHDPEFRAGIDHELARMRANIAEGRRHVAYLVDKLAALGNHRNFFIDFNVGEFVAQLRHYWKQHVPLEIMERS